MSAKKKTTSVSSFLESKAKGNSGSSVTGTSTSSNSKTNGNISFLDYKEKESDYLKKQRESLKESVDVTEIPAYRTANGKVLDFSTTNENNALRYPDVPNYSIHNTNYTQEEWDKISAMDKVRVLKYNNLLPESNATIQNDTHDDIYTVTQDVGETYVTPKQLEKFKLRKIARDAEVMQRNIDSAKKFGEAHPLIGEALSQSTGLVGNALGIIGSIQGKDSSDPIYTMARRSTAYGEGIKNKVSDITGATDDTLFNMPVTGTGVSGRDLVGFGVDTVSSMAQSMLGMSLGMDASSIFGSIGSTGRFIGVGSETAKKIASAVSQSVISASAYTNTYLDAIDRGISRDKALILATTAGITEWVTEKYSIEGLLKDKQIYGWKDAVLNVVKQMGTEGSEELAADLLNGATNYLVLADESDFEVSKREYIAQGMTEDEATTQVIKDFVSQCIGSFVGGAVSGAVFGTAKSTSDMFEVSKNGLSKDFATETDIANLRDAIMDNPAYYMHNGQVNNDALEFAKDFKSFAGQMQEKVAKGGTLTNLEKARLGADQDRLYKMTVSGGFSGTNEIAEQNSRANAETENNNKKNTDIIKTNPNVKNTDGSVNANSISSDNAVLKKYGITDVIETADLIKETGNFSKKYEANVGLTKEEFKNLKKTGKVTVYSYQEIGSGDAWLTTSKSGVEAWNEGKNDAKIYSAEVNASDVVWDKTDGFHTGFLKSQLVDNTAQNNNLESKATTTTMTTEQKLQSISENADKINVALNVVKDLGKTGNEDLSNILSGVADNNKSNVAIGYKKVYDASRFNASENTLNNAYSYARNNGLNSEQIKSAFKAGQTDAKADLNEEIKAINKEGGASEKVFKYSRYDDNVKESLNKIGKKMNITIDINDAMGKNEGAMWQKGSRTLTLNPNANDVVGALWHDLTHVIQDTDNTAYLAYRNFVIEYLATKDGLDVETFLDRMVTKYRNVYESHDGKKYNREKLMDEIVADAAMEFSNNESAVKRFAREHSDVVAKIIQFFDDIIETLNSYFGVSKGNEVSAKLKEDMKSFIKARDLWYKALESASESSEANFSESETVYSIDSSYDNQVKAMMGTMFSGAGTFEFALRNMIYHGYAVEYNPQIAAIYMDNNGKAIFVGDVRQAITNGYVRSKKIDWLHASPVCCNYSKQKTNQGETPLDVKTARAVLFGIRQNLPRVVTVENVAGYEDSEAVNIIKDALTRYGYKFDEGVYKASDYGAATIRERYFIRAIKKTDANDTIMPAKPVKTHDKSNAVSWYSVTEDLISGLNPMPMKKGGYMERRWNATKHKIDTSHPVLVLRGNTNGKDLVYAEWNEPSPTIIANESEARIVMPDGRVLGVTPRVLARIQGLSDDFKLPMKKNGEVHKTLANTAIGNGIPVELSQAIAGSLMTQIEGIDEVRFSLSTDSNGNKLTVQQEEYFKDSKVRDENGNLLVVYHTTSSDFTVFDKGKKGDNTFAPNTYMGFFFTDNPEYFTNGKWDAFNGGKTQKYYINIKNPIDFTNISREAFSDIIESFGGDSNEVENAKKVWDKEEKKQIDLQNRYGYKDHNVLLSNVYEKLSGEMFDETLFIESLEPHYNDLMSKGYDGVINYLDEMEGSKEYIVLDSNQSKLTSNEIPTSNEDIRYSLSSNVDINEVNNDDIRYCIETPYTFRSKAEIEFVDRLSPKAKNTYEFISNLHNIGRKNKASVIVDVGEKAHKKTIDVTTRNMRAQEWNSYVDSNQNFANVAKMLAEAVPEDIRRTAYIAKDGHIIIDENSLEQMYRMERSFMQRIVDSLPMDTKSKYSAEEYRQALVEERRSLYAAGKLKPKSISGLSKDVWGSMGFLAANTKTVASGDFTTICPQIMFNGGCFYCYRLSALKSGVNNKLTGMSIWYTGDILRISKEDIKRLNDTGGLRIQSFGDWDNVYTPQLRDMLEDAKTVGLNVKIITKETSMIDTVARLREQGVGVELNSDGTVKRDYLFFNISADYTIESAEMSDNVNPTRPYTFGHFETDDNGNEVFVKNTSEEATNSAIEGDGKVKRFWKRALTIDEADVYRQKYDWVNIRIVATNEEEFIRGLKDPRVDVVTGYHGKDFAKSGFQRVSSEDGNALLDVEALGDSGMPRFVYDANTKQWSCEDGKHLFSIDKNTGEKVYTFSGRTKVHKSLAERIARENLEYQYYYKTCCQTGKCVSCNGICGKTHRLNQYVGSSNASAWWKNNMIANPDFYKIEFAKMLSSKEYIDMDDRFSLNVDDYIDKKSQEYAEEESKAMLESMREKVGVDIGDRTLPYYYKGLQEANDKVGEFLQNYHFVPTKGSIRKVAQEMMKETESNRNIDELISKLSSLYEYLYNEKHPDIAEVSNTAKGIAEWLLEDQKDYYDETEVKLYKDFKAALRQYTIFVDEDNIGDLDKYDGIDALRRRYRNNLHISRTTGRTAEVVVQQMREEFPGTIPVESDRYNLSNPADALDFIVEKLETMKPQVQVRDTDYDEWSYLVGQKIYDAYFEQKFKPGDYTGEKLYAEYKKAINSFKKSSKADFQKRWDRYMNQERNKVLKRNIVKSVKKLTRTLENPTNNKHIPEMLRKPLAQMLLEIDFSSANSKIKTEEWMDVANALLSISTEKVKDSEGNIIFMTIDPDLASKMKDLKGKLNEITGDGITNLDKLSRSDLEKLNEIMSSLNKVVETANQMIGDSQKRKVSYFGNGTINDLSGFKMSRDFGNAISTLKNLGMNEMLDSYTRFHTFGSHAEEILQEIENGFALKVKYIKQAQDYHSELKERLGVTDKEFNDWGNKVTHTVKGTEFTAFQLMELYEFMKREQAKKHVLVGGVTPANFVKKSGNPFGEITKAESNIHFTEEEIKSLFKPEEEGGLLSQKQKDYADGLARFFQVCADWGNKASMDLYGYRKFKDPNYIHITVDPFMKETGSVELMSEGKVQRTLKDNGIAKNINPDANNAIMLVGLQNNFEEHINTMASYGSLLVPLDDLRKWWEYRSTNNNESTHRNQVKGSINTVYGSSATGYVNKLIAELNGTSADQDRYMFSNMTSAMKAAAVGFNLSVAVQQPTAYVRAFAVMDGKYLLGALERKLDGKYKYEADYELIKKWSYIAQWKDWGFYDINIGKSMHSILSGSTTFGDKLRDASMYLAGKGDEAAWKRLWVASELQVREQNKGLEIGTDEYYEEVARVFNNVINRTQVVDSTLNRSQIMRNKDSKMKEITAFMGEPMKSYNMLYRAVFDRAVAKTKEEKKVASGNLVKAGVAFVLSAFASALMKSFITAARRSGADREKNFWERYLEALIEEFLGNLDISGMIPYVKDVVDMGVDIATKGNMDMPERSDLAWMQDIYYVAKRWKQTLEGKYSIPSSLVYSTRALSTVSSIGIYNITRDTNAVINSFFEAIGWDEAEYEKLKMSKPVAGNISKYVAIAARYYAEGKTGLGDKVVKDILDTDLESDSFHTKMVNVLAKDEESARKILNSTKDDSLKEDSLKALYNIAKGERKNLSKEQTLDIIKGMDLTDEQKGDLYEAKYGTEALDLWKEKGGTSYEYMLYGKNVGKDDLEKLDKQGVTFADYMEQRKAIATKYNDVSSKTKSGWNAGIEKANEDKKVTKEEIDNLALEMISKGYDDSEVGTMYQSQRDDDTITEWSGTTKQYIEFRNDVADKKEEMKSKKAKTEDTKKEIAKKIKGYKLSEDDMKILWELAGYEVDGKVTENGNEKVIEDKNFDKYFK